MFDMLRMLSMFKKIDVILFRASVLLHKSEPNFNGDVGCPTQLPQTRPKVRGVMHGDGKTLAMQRPAMARDSADEARERLRARGRDTVGRPASTCCA